MKGRVHPEGIEPASLVPKTSTLSVELWVLRLLFPNIGFANRAYLIILYGWAP